MERYIGLDLGTTTLGIAISDSLGIVYGRENFNFERGNYKKAREHVLDLVNKENIYNIVIGLPLTLDNQVGERAKSVKRFMEDILKINDKIQVFYQDERYSTIEAYERMNEMNMKKTNKENLIGLASIDRVTEVWLTRKKQGNMHLP